MSGATPYICLIELYERNRATALKKHRRFFQKKHMDLYFCIPHFQYTTFHLF